MITHISHIDISCGIHRYAARGKELSVAVALGAPLSQEAPISQEFLDARVPRTAVSRTVSPDVKSFASGRIT